MNTSPSDSSSAPLTETPEEISRRRFFEKLSIALVGLCTAIVGVPLVGFIVAPFFRTVPREWVTIGKPDDFQIGKTVAVTVTDPSSLPWAGVTAKSAVWLRRVSQDSFIAFSVNLDSSRMPSALARGAELFMCPCHGGVYYDDGAVAAGPPPRPLFRYDVRVANGEVQMKQAIVPISTTL